MAARDARAEFEASVRFLKWSVPAISKKIDIGDARLAVLEDKVAEMKTKLAVMTSAMGTAPLALRHVSGPATKTKCVSFDDDRDLRSYELEETDVFVPLHGHWLPTSVTSSRPSFEQADDFAKQLGGRVVTTHGCLECILVEPMGKILSPAEYVGTGLIICINNLPPSQELLEEWSQVLKQTKWLDAGLSFAMPSPGELKDLEVLAEETLARAGYDKVLLAGKGAGAQQAVELAATERLASKVAGIILVAPASPVPAACRQLEIPVLLVWAQDDTVSPFTDIECWAEALDSRHAPSALKDAFCGGHDMAKVLASAPDIAKALLFFTAAVLLMADLLSIETRHKTSTDVNKSWPELPERSLRLCDELPSFLAGQVGMDSPGTEEEGITAAISSSVISHNTIRRLIQVMTDWIEMGMPEMASASE